MAYLHQRRNVPAMTLSLPPYDVNQGPGPMSAPVFSQGHSPLSPAPLTPLSAAPVEYSLNPNLPNYYNYAGSDFSHPLSSADSTSTGGGICFINATVESVKEQIIREETMPKKKRVRTSSSQLSILQEAFQQDPMPNAATRTALAERLGMTSRAVQVWFQNRRAKMKLDQKRGSAAGLLEPSAFTDATDAIKPSNLTQGQQTPSLTDLDPPTEAEKAKPNPPRSVQRLRTPSTDSMNNINPNLARHNSLPNIHYPPGYPSPASPHALTIKLPHAMARHNSIDCGECISEMAPGLPPSPSFSSPPSPCFTRRPSLLRSYNASPALQQGYYGGPRTTSPALKHHPYFPARMVSRRHSVFEQVPTGRVVYANLSNVLPVAPSAELDHLAVQSQSPVNGAFEQHLLPYRDIPGNFQSSPIHTPSIQCLTSTPSSVEQSDYFGYVHIMPPQELTSAPISPLSVNLLEGSSPELSQPLVHTNAPDAQLTYGAEEYPTALEGCAIDQQSWQADQQNISQCISLGIENVPLTLSNNFSIDPEVIDTTASLDQLHLSTITEGQVYDAYSYPMAQQQALLDITAPALDISSGIPSAAQAGRPRSNSFLKRSMSSPDIYGYLADERTDYGCESYGL